MAPTEKVKLWAKAKRLGVSGYRTMTVADLNAAIKSAEGKSGSTGRKTAAKSSTNGRKSAGRKTAGRKSAGRKTAASAKASPAKSAKTGAKASRKPARASTDNGDAGRAAIDDENIDWTAEWGGGQRGNRKTIMDRLRKSKGNVDKVFKALAPKAQSMYPKTTDGRKRGKAAAETLLRWHISRIKFDFVKATDQHESSESNAWVRGKASVKPAKRTVGRKSTRGPGRPKGSKTAAKSSGKTAGRQNRSGGRRPSTPAKRAAGRSRKTAASRKR